MRNGISEFEVDYVAPRRSWDELMERARTRSLGRGERVKVSAVRDRDDRWLYVIECPSWCGCRING